MYMKINIFLKLAMEPSLSDIKPRFKFFDLKEAGRSPQILVCFLIQTLVFLSTSLMLIIYPIAHFATLSVFGDFNVRVITENT